ncbi:MAG: hypothetical protein Q9191_007141, partial [Dirinaria sp. TL-2023a]
EMAGKVKAKAKTYGKKGGRAGAGGGGDLSDEFAGLSLSASSASSALSAPASVAQQQRRRQALSETSSNTAPRRPRTRAPRALAKRERVAAKANAAAHKLRSQLQRQQQQQPRGGEGSEDDLREYLRPLTEVAGEVEGFTQWTDTIFAHFDVAKIGDGSYADVFKVAPKVKGSSDAFVISKLIPLRPMIRPRGLKWRDMTTIEDALSEIRLLDAMTEIPGFVEYRAAKLLRGDLPEPMKKVCTAYYAARRWKVNADLPNTNRSLANPADQIWLLIEMSDAGKDLDTLLTEGDASGTLPLRKEKRLDIRQLRDIFWGAANVLAHGEQEKQFEHRDLHLSNICLKKSKEHAADESYAFVPESSNLVVTLIDYTLSRAKADDKPMFNPMSDAEIFTGQGDLQFETYRHMRKAVKVGRKAQWDAFVPLTNVLWLHHLLAKLLEKTAPAGEEAPVEKALWTGFEGLRDDTDPDKMPDQWTYLSAKDIVALGKIGEAQFKAEVLTVGADGGDEEDSPVMQKAKAERYKRLHRQEAKSEDASSST